MHENILHETQDRHGMCFCFLAPCLYVNMMLLFLSAWLEGEDDPVIAIVNQRIEDITGLTVDTAELLQVSYYTY